MAKRPQRRVSVARVEKRGRDAAKIARPNELVDMVAVVVELTPRRGWGGDERTRVRFVLEAVQERERSTCKLTVVAADLAEGLRNLGLRLPRALECLADISRALLQGHARDLFGARTRGSETDRQLEGSGTNPDLLADVHVA